MTARLLHVAARAMGKKPTKKIQPAVTLQPCAPSPVTLKGGQVLVSVHLKPGAKITQVTDYLQDSVEISVSAPPVEGEANLLLLQFLAEILEVKKSQVSLQSGHKSRNKVVSVSGIPVEDAAYKLKNAVSS